MIRILTDIRIAQSPSWQRKTVFLEDLVPSCVSPNGSFDILRGIVAPVRTFLNLVRHRRNFEVIVNADIRAGQLFALFRSMFKVRKPKHIILELMLDEKKNETFWKLKKALQRIIFSSVEVVFVSSTQEVTEYSKRFGMDTSRFRFLPFHTNITEPKIVEQCQGYILSAGKTGRDYATLCAAAKDVDQKFIIVSDKVSAEGIEFPTNVTVLYDIPYSDYLFLLQNCRLVVVPLKKLLKSTGQVFFLEAMALGKPVIATETTGTVDYIKSGYNGLLVAAGDYRQLRQAITELMEQPGLYRNLAENGLKTILERHTFEKYTGKILQAAFEIARN
jgi:glycosyltransferase involved in cell wall biosynthesis